MWCGQVRASGVRLATTAAAAVRGLPRLARLISSQAQQREAGVDQQLVVQRERISSKPTQYRVSVVMKNVQEAQQRERDTSKWTKEYLEAPIINLKRELQGSFPLDPAVFAERIRPDIIHRVLLHRMAKMRNQNAIKPVKRRCDVVGGKKKPHPQKGQGRARQGSKNAPHMRGGGAAHPPKPHDRSIDLQAKVLKLGMRSALSAKYALGKLVLVDSLDMSTRKTKEFAELMEKYKWNTTMLLLDSHSDFNNTYWATRRISTVDYLSVPRTNIWDILRKDLILATPAAVDELIRIYSPSK